MKNNVLVTGACGFIGFHTVIRLLDHGYRVIGIDNMNSFYNAGLKELRLSLLVESDEFTFIRESIENRAKLEEIFQNSDFDMVIHLAGQAGVRSSPSEANYYIVSNLVGFWNVLDLCRVHEIKHLVYASSSSVYGGQASPPFSTTDSVDFPQSLYAATKRSNELIAYSISRQFGLPVTGLRFFTVYGPFGRPDMAVYSFAKSIIEGEYIDLYDDGLLYRDFTFIDDVVDSIIDVLHIPPTVNDLSDMGKGMMGAPSRILNVGSGTPIQIRRMVKLLEFNLQKSAKIHSISKPIVDMDITHADVTGLIGLTGNSPKVSIDDGISRFCDWFLSYYSDL